MNLNFAIFMFAFSYIYTLLLNSINWNFLLLCWSVNTVYQSVSWITENVKGLYICRYKTSVMSLIDIQDDLLTVPIFHIQTCCTQNTPKTKLWSVANIFGIAEPRTWLLRTWELWYWTRVKMGPGVTSQYESKKINAIIMMCRRKWLNIARDIQAEIAAVFRDRLVAYDRLPT